MRDSPTGRRPTFPEFQDFRLRQQPTRKYRIGDPPEKHFYVDYLPTEARLLEHMVYQAMGGKVAMAALMANLPPGAKVHMDEVDLTEVAPEDLRKYEVAMREWLDRYSIRPNKNTSEPQPTQLEGVQEYLYPYLMRRGKTCATDETPSTSSATPEEPDPATGAPAEPTSGD